jgi:endonuclease YncB( thermonuclease family)
VDIDGQSSWLDEVLVEKGYARIITQPADLPDGSKAESHRTLLQQLEASAKNRKAGGWK